MNIYKTKSYRPRVKLAPRDNNDSKMKQILTNNKISKLSYKKWCRPKVRLSNKSDSKKI